MGQNRLKDEKQESGKSFFAKLEGLLDRGTLVQKGLHTRYLPHLVFVATLAVIYIANTHYADRLRRSHSKLIKEVRDLRADYTTLKADYMFESKQSEVAKKVEKLNLRQDTKPPFKIVVKKGEY